MSPELTGTDVPRFSALFKAFSDETRIKILMHLEKKSSRVNDLVDKFNLSQSTISRHLAVLKTAGLVIRQRMGKEVHYSLNPNCIVGCCCRFFGAFSCCAPYLSRGKGQVTKRRHSCEGNRPSRRR